MKKKAYSAQNVNSVDLAKVVANREGVAAEVGVDVSKKDLMLMLRWGRSDFERPWKVENPHQILEAVKLLEGLSAGRRLRVAMEPSGTYGDAFRQAVTRAGLELHRVSPKACHDYAEVFDGVPSQHDAKDAGIVAELCSMDKGRPWPWETPEAWLAELEEQVEEMEAHRRIGVMWCGRLEALLARHWPESLGILKVSTTTLKRAIMEYGGPAALAADEEAEQKLKRWGRACLKPEKARALVASARQTVGVEETAAAGRRMRRMAQRAWEASRAADKASRALEKLAAGHEVIQRMARVVGVGTACVLWVHVGDPREYPWGEAYAKAMGLNLKERSSGRWQGKLKISKRGSAVARRWLYLASLRLVRNHKPVRQWYVRAKVRAEASGALAYRSGSVAAAVGVMRRVARALHAVAVSDTVFEPSRLFPGSRKQRR